MHKHSSFSTCTFPRLIERNKVGFLASSIVCGQCLAGLLSKLESTNTAPSLLFPESLATKKVVSFSVKCCVQSNVIRGYMCYFVSECGWNNEVL